MKAKGGLQQLIEDAGVSPVLVRQPCLPAPAQPVITASEEDHTLARELLADQRRRNPDYKDPNKQLKRIFKTAKEKEKLQDTNRWDFSQDEIDQALSAVIDKPATSPGLIQAFLNLGAKVNFIDTSDDKKTKGTKKPDVALRRRSTVLQQAATSRRADSVSLLASSGADQTTLDIGLKAALAANDYSCVQELLRHGADINSAPNALADAVRSNNQNLVRLLMRAPKALSPDIISSCLPAAVQHKSEPMVSLLVGNGADPNFNGATALSMAISSREYRLCVALVAGPIPLTNVSLQGLFEVVRNMHQTPQETYQYLQLLLCCGLSPSSPGLPGLLVAATKRNDTDFSLLLIQYGVSTALNDSECLRHAISHSNWDLADSILQTPLSPTIASAVLASLSLTTPKLVRIRIISALVQHGASGPSLAHWLIKAVEESDFQLIDLLLQAGAPLESGNSRALHSAVARKDMQSLQTLLKARPSPESLSDIFPLLRQGYSPAERLATARLLLQHGAHGPGVDQALVDAVADTSNSRDVALITELVRYGANVNHDGGKALGHAVTQADIPILHLLCKSKPTPSSTSAALPLAFDTNGKRHSSTTQIMELLLKAGIEEKPALVALEIAVRGGLDNMDIINRLITANARLLGPAFQYAIALKSITKKAPIISSLLRLGITQGAIDEALAAETRHAADNNDVTVLNILLGQGASVNFNDGEALSAGVASGNYALIKLLLSGKKPLSRANITKAFRAFFYAPSLQDTSLNQDDRVEIARELLTRGVEQPAIDSALRTVLDVANVERNIEGMVDLLLQHRANVNTADGTCFVFAANRNDFVIFNKLLVHHPEFNTIVPLLLTSKLDEEVVVKALQACFDHGCTSDNLSIGTSGIFKKPPLFLAIQEYPRSEVLVKSLLDHGCNPNTTANGVINKAIGEEILPILVWALAQPQRMISSAVIIALLSAGASPTRAAPVSEVVPIGVAARNGRDDIVQELLNRGADASARDKWNRSALFYASRTSVTTIVQSLSAHALKDDGSLHEAARCLHLENVIILIKQGHSPNFPSRFHSGRHALGELCLNAEATIGAQLSKARQILRLLLSNGANPTFKARNERSAVILALDNPHCALELTEALLETEVWQNINDEAHMYREASGLWYSPIKYVELVPSPSRARCKTELIELLRDKGCTPRFYSETLEQPEGAIGMPPPIAALADRQKEHQLSLRLAREAAEHARTLEENSHRDYLRRKQEQQDADLAAQAIALSKWQALEQQKHEFEMQRVRSAEHMKRQEKVAWHSLATDQERDLATQRLQIEERKASVGYASEAKLVKLRQQEVEHRATVEKKALEQKEQLYDRNVKRQKQLTDRLDESAQLHAKLRQERPAIEGAPQWGSVD
jgi:ankyrin repeat protein